MSRTRRIAAAGSAALALAAVGCGSSDDSSSGGSGDKGPFKVLAVLPLSGQVATIGAADRTAIRVSADMVNADGGIGGKQVSVKFVDSAGTATQAVSVLQKELGSGSSYNLVIAGATSGEAVPMAPFLNRQKVLTCTSAASDELARTPSYLFGTSTLSSRIGGAVIASLQKAGYRKAAAMFPDTELARSTLAAARSAASAAGISFNATVVDPTAIDLRTQMSKLRASNPDVLVLDGFGPVATVMLKARTTLGWDVPVVGDSSMGVNDFTSLAGKRELDGVKLNMQQVDLAGSEATRSSAFTTFLAQLKRASPQLPFGMEVYADNYSCLPLARAAAEKAGSTDATKMRDALETISDGSSIKGWFMASNVYAKNQHYPAYDLNEWWTTVPVGVRKDGLMVPGQG